MSQRQADLHQLRSMLEHLHLCQQELSRADEPDAVEFLTHTMLHDLDQCRRLCRNLHTIHHLASLQPVC